MGLMDESREMVERWSLVVCRCLLREKSREEIRNGKRRTGAFYVTWDALVGPPVSDTVKWCDG